MWTRFLARSVFIALLAVTQTVGQLPVSGAGPLCRGPYLQLGTSTSIVVRWRTDVATVGRVGYGAAPGDLNLHQDEAAATTEHEVTVSGLSPETTYYYSVGTANSVLAGDDGEHFFTTAPPVGEERATRVWILGDSGAAGTCGGGPCGDDARAVRDAYLAFTGSRHTDLWLMLGDNGGASGTDAEYQHGVFENMYESVLRKSVLWPTRGNHENADLSIPTIPYYDIFTLPTNGEAGGVPSATEAYYSFDWANIHFVCLDSEACGSTAPIASPPCQETTLQAMISWLHLDLSATTQDWVVAYWHHPPYSKGKYHDSDLEERMMSARENLVPVLEAYGVDLVLSGHSHSYERSRLLDGHYGLSSSVAPSAFVSDGDGRLEGDGAYRKTSPGRSAHEGAVYVVAGSGSTKRGTPGDPILDHPVMVGFPGSGFQGLVELGSVVLDISGLQMDVRFLNSAGVVRDHFTVVKGMNSALPSIASSLVPELATWRYDDTGTDLGSAWRATGYDDSGWAAGAGMLGYSMAGGEAAGILGTTLSPGKPAYYFRSSFILKESPALITSLSLAIKCDDGFVAWLNGQEIARRGLPAAVTYATLAASHQAQDYEVVPLSVPGSLLVQGQNVLAIELHQASVASSDLAFDAALHFEALVSPLGHCPEPAPGTSVLTIDGFAGGPGLSLDVPVGESLSFEVSTPAGFPGGGAHFAIFGQLGVPGPGDAFSLGALGVMCLAPACLIGPPPVATAPWSVPPFFVLASSFGPGLPAAIPASPTPWSWTLGAGLPMAGWEITLQVVVESSPGVLRVGNALRFSSVP